MKDFPKTCQPTKLLRFGPIFVLDVFSKPPAGKIDPRLAFSRPDGVLEKPQESFRLDVDRHFEISGNLLTNIIIMVFTINGLCAIVWPEPIESLMETQAAQRIKASFLIFVLGYGQIFTSSANGGLLHNLAPHRVVGSLVKVAVSPVVGNRSGNGRPFRLSKRAWFVQKMRERAEEISRQGFPYVFGGSSPSDGGMDCSGTVKFLLSGLGFKDVPRTSYQQYDWLKKKHLLHRTRTIPAKMGGGRGGLHPGNLIFWGGTYHSGHKVSHVMIYLGQAPDGRHYMFGARGKSKTGLFGSGVDIFELRSGKQKSLIGYGRLPGTS